MGKSVLSKKIAFNCVKNKVGLPILIELRNFNVNEELDQYIFQKLHFQGKVENKILNSICEIIILDGFDEVLQENHDLIINKINSFSKIYDSIPIILTSREESILSTLYGFKRFQINKLEITEAFKLLEKYSTNKSFTKKMIAAVKAEQKSVGEFLGTPLYVSLLFCAYMYKHDIPLKRHLFYSQVFDALYSGHDLTKSQGFSRPKKSKLDPGEFHTVLRHLAYKSLQKGMIIDYSDDELRIVIDEIKENIPQLLFRSSDFIYDLSNSVPLFLREGPCIKWNHKSLMEYFAARFICHDIGDNRNIVISQIHKSPKLDSYMNILSLVADIDYRFFRNQIMLELLKKLKEHIKKYKNNITNRRIAERDIVERSCLTFERNIALYIKKLNIKKRNGNNKIVNDEFTKIANLIQKESKGFTKIIGTTGIDCNCLISTGWIETNFREILSIGLRHEHDYAVFDKLDGVGNNHFDITKTTIPIDVLIMIDNDKSSIINNSKNFKFINNIISRYESQSTFFIDEINLTKLIESIENDKISDKNYLLSGI